MNFNNRLITSLLVLVLHAGSAAAQSGFAPVWRVAPWDSGGTAPNSAVWSMAASELDLDRDGKKEFLVTSAWSGAYYNSAYLFEAGGNNTFQLVWSYSFYPYSNDYSAVAVADLDANGRQEILCLIDPYDSTYHGFYVFEWNGTDNGFPLLPTTTWDLRLPGAFDEGTAILAGDFDSDGRDEVALSLIERFSLPKSRFMIFSLATGSSFTAPVWNTEFQDTITFAYLGYGLQSTDLDRDGRTEIVACGWDWLHVALYEHTGTPNSFVRAASIVQIDTTVDFSNMGFVEANFDNNNTNELYIATATGCVYVMTNPGNVAQITRDNFTLLGQYNSLRGIAGMTRGDIDRNGIPELYLAGSYHEAVFQWRYTAGSVNNPASYIRSMIYQDDTTDQHTAGSDQGWLRPSKVAVGDFDADGTPDIVLASASLAADKPVVMMIERQPVDVHDALGRPLTFSLQQNHPNPFNPATTVRFSLNTRGRTSLRVFDLLGKEVALLMNEILEPGEYAVPWLAKALPSGTYFCRLSSGDETAIIKMQLLK